MNESQDNYGESKHPDRKNLENANESTVTERRPVVALGWWKMNLEKMWEGRIKNRHKELFGGDRYAHSLVAVKLSRVAKYI